LVVQGFVEDLWADIGSPERYLAATRLLLERTTEGQAPVLGRDEASVADGSHIGGRVLLGANAHIASGASVVGPSVVGAGVRVGEGARVEASVVWEQADVGACAQVKGSIIGAGARVGPRATVVDAVVADGAEIAADVNLSAGARVNPGEHL